MPAGLTRTEGAILDVLAAGGGQAVSVERIVAEVWGWERCEESERRLVASHVSKMRRKLAAGTIIEAAGWRWGVRHGYVLIVPREAA